MFLLFLAPASFTAVCQTIWGYGALPLFALLMPSPGYVLWVGCVVIVSTFLMLGLGLFVLQWMVLRWFAFEVFLQVLQWIDPFWTYGDHHDVDSVDEDVAGAVVVPSGGRNSNASSTKTSNLVNKQSSQTKAKKTSPEVLISRFPLLGLRHLSIWWLEKLQRMWIAVWQLLPIDTVYAFALRAAGAEVGRGVKFGRKLPKIKGDISLLSIGDDVLMHESCLISTWQPDDQSDDVDFQKNPSCGTSDVGTTRTLVEASVIIKQQVGDHGGTTRTHGSSRNCCTSLHDKKPESWSP